MARELEALGAAGTAVRETMVVVLTVTSAGVGVVAESKVQAAAAVAAEATQAVAARVVDAASEAVATVVVSMKRPVRRRFV